MVIFTVSAQHSALRAGQFDYDSWFPNAPGSLKRPPPTSKGSSDKNTLLDTLPDMKTSAYLVSVFWLLSKPSLDLVPLGQYPEDYFCQMALQNMIRDHQAELSFLSPSMTEIMGCKCLTRTCALITSATVSAFDTEWCDLRLLKHHVLV
ncbi:hydroperoxide isomerase ALOXE3-like [Sinocyclocheilus anshuiensis]|uniref:hydroperoxide isomerase ALOXE3-like n=1 Tax=Sinocyclocheilus anshuiensis TaxID=1608454 RepID=UPI0007BAD5D1|nr:PREDICTED: hydroperoxide isomerase ALOXE3-like [Sinocyclocheilus anshuiensis]